MMKKLLIFVDWFAPGFKGGGQIQSCINLARALQQKMDVKVVTTDRDLGSDEPYPDIKTDEWRLFENNISVIYLSPQNVGYKSIRSIINTVEPDVVYLNSMFSYHFTLLPLEVCRFNNWRARVILAPRGMLHSGALQYKKLKKSLFFHAFKVRQFHKRVIFHATDKTEEADIRRVFGKSARVKFVEDFPASKQEALVSIEKNSGHLRCLFVSRISPKKNLLLTLKLMQQIKAQTTFTIVGPAEDSEYWTVCQTAIALLPSNVRVEFLGPVPNHLLGAIYRAHHLFILPTFGENFGHVIFESLVNGRPVLISDRTPWRQLSSQKVGWDIPLENELDFSQALQQAAGWTQDDFDAYSLNSWKRASSFIDTSSLAGKYIELFQ